MIVVLKRCACVVVAFSYFVRHVQRARRRSYDFGYLLKLLTCLPLPTAEAEFFELMRLFFPVVCDAHYVPHAVVLMCF